jgi:hypothetical protein
MLFELIQIYWCFGNCRCGALTAGMAVFLVKVEAIQNLVWIKRD